MHWFERKIRRYEHRRWTTDDNRRVQPFYWGLEHIGGSPDEPNPGAFVREYAPKPIESSREWHAAPPAPDYPLPPQNFLTSPTPIHPPCSGAQSRPPPPAHHPKPPRTAAAASTGSNSRATPSSAFSAPASALRSAISPSFTMNASAPAASSTSPPTTPTSSARA